MANKYRIQAAFTIWKMVTVTAKNERQAIAKAKDKIHATKHRVLRKEIDVQYVDDITY